MVLQEAVNAILTPGGCKQGTSQAMALAESWCNRLLATSTAVPSTLTEPPSTPVPAADVVGIAASATAASAEAVTATVASAQEVTATITSTGGVAATVASANVVAITAAFLEALDTPASSADVVTGAVDSADVVTATADGNAVSDTTVEDAAGAERDVVEAAIAAGEDLSHFRALLRKARSKLEAATTAASMNADAASLPSNALGEARAAAELQVCLSVFILKYLFLYVARNNLPQKPFGFGLKYNVN